MAKEPFFRQNNGKLSTNPPKYLGPVAAACWRKIVPYLLSTDKVDRIDTQIVERYCIAYENYRKAYDDIMQNGSVIENKKAIQDNSGQILDMIVTRVQKNPNVDIQKDSSREMDTLGSQLGLSPEARSRLFELSNNKDEKEASTAEQIAAFFGKNTQKGDDQS